MPDMINVQSDALYIGVILFLILAMIVILSAAGFISTVT
jgi:hypothetical protein